jgi:hypothetical protein
MNVTGCPPLYAVDNFFEPNPDGSECELSILALVIFSELSGIIHLAVLIKRTQIIRSNWKKRKASPICTVLSLLPYVTLAQSTGTFVLTVMTPVVWYLYSPAGFMAALIYLCFAIQCETWLAKLIRLGGRLIPKGKFKIPSSDDSYSFEDLSRSDTLLKVLAVITRTGIVVQFVIGVIVYPLNFDDPFWFRLCVTFQAILPTLWMISVSFAAAILEWMLQLTMAASHRSIGNIDAAKTQYRGSQKRQKMLKQSVLRRWKESYGY